MTLRRRKWYDGLSRSLLFLPVAIAEDSVMFAVWGMTTWASGQDGTEVGYLLYI